MKKFKSVNMGIFMEIYRSILCMKRVATTDPKLTRQTQVFKSFFLHG